MAVTYLVHWPWEPISTLKLSKTKTTVTRCSLVTVFKRKDAILQDKPVAYFYFLRLGTVVPLRSGDVLIFNPRELSTPESSSTLFSCSHANFKRKYPNLFWRHSKPQFDHFSTQFIFCQYSWFIILYSGVIDILPPFFSSMNVNTVEL